MEILESLNVPLVTIKSTCYRYFNNEVADKRQFSGSLLNI